MFRAFTKLWALLSPRERRTGAQVFLIMVVMAVLEVVGIASVTPFLAVLGNPDVIHKNGVLAWAFEFGGFTSTQTFLIFLGLLSFVLMVTVSAYRTFAAYVIYRYTSMRRYSISMRLLRGYLNEPYAFFLNRNSADLTKSILSEVDQVVTNALVPGMQMLAYGLMIAVVVAFLVVVDPLLALIVACLFSVLYCCAYWSVRGVLGRTGTQRVAANRARFAAAAEALGGIKDIKVLGREAAYAKKFRGPSIQFASAQAINQTLSEVPKYAIEAVAVGAILLLAVVLLTTRGDLGEILPVLGLYTFAGYRLLPAAQKVYAGAAKLRFGAAAIDVLYADLSKRMTGSVAHSDPEASALGLRRSLTLDNVSFSYPGSARPSLNAINLEIVANTTVGIVGATGAGKSTVVDIILGLLEPSQGRLLIDGVEMNAALRPAWLKSIGYVPQHIFLADDSVAANIALGVPKHQIDMAMVERVARAAKVHQFVSEEMPRGYQTEVGERGVRLSGGQRQRIGIARALYRDPDVLLLDEATSALDNLTEKEVMEAIRTLSHRKTIVLVAHRLSTVRECDRIFLFEHGKLAASGSYQELVADNQGFRAMTATATTLI